MTNIRQNHEYLQIILNLKFIKKFVQVAKSWKFNTRFSITLAYNNYKRTCTFAN